MRCPDCKSYKIHKYGFRRMVQYYRCTVCNKNFNLKKYDIDGNLRPVIKRWSLKHDCCVRCGGTDRRHRGHGICERCRESLKFVSKKTFYKLTEDQRAKLLETARKQIMQKLKGEKHETKNNRILSKV